MMFTFGDARTGCVESVDLMEDIARQHVASLTRRAADLAGRRRVGPRAIQLEDIAFLLREEHAKLARLEDFLKWKEIRKRGRNTLQQTGGADDNLDPKRNQKEIEDARRSLKKSRVIFNVTTHVAELCDDCGIDVEELVGSQIDECTLRRLEATDKLTANMSCDAYLEYTRCREASFTFMKTKKFRAWVDFDSLGVKPLDDIVDTLGYLAWEMVGAVTLVALLVKALADGFINRRQHDHAIACGLFLGFESQLRMFVDEGRVKCDHDNSFETPILPWHLHEALRRMQAVSQPLQGPPLSYSRISAVL